MSKRSRGADSEGPVDPSIEGLDQADLSHDVGVPAEKPVAAPPSQRVTAPPCQSCRSPETYIYATRGAKRYCKCEKCGHTWAHVVPKAEPKGRERLPLLGKRGTS